MVGTCNLGGFISGGGFNFPSSDISHFELLEEDMFAVIISLTLSSTYKLLKIMKNTSRFIQYHKIIFEFLSTFSSYSKLLIVIQGHDELFVCKRNEILWLDH